MKIYVAAKFEEATRVQDVYKTLRARGFQITHDWTTEDSSVFPEGPEKLAYKHACAMNDYFGVKNADAVLVLNHPLLYGGAAEMGMAIALHVPVYVVGAEIRENIFFHLGAPQVWLCPNLQDAIARLVAVKADRL